VQTAGIGNLNQDAIVSAVRISNATSTVA